MAVAPSPSAGTLDPKPDNSDPEVPQSASQVPSPLPPPASAPSAAAPTPAENPNPNPNPNPTVVTLPPPPIPSFAPSFRPLGAPTAPQYSILPNSGLQNPSFSMTQSPGIQPPGVNAPGVSFSIPPVRPGGMYSFGPGQPPAAAPMAYGQVPMGYMTVPGAPPQAPSAMPPPFGYARYPAPYPNMVRPGFPPRPMPPFGVIPPLSRPPIPGVRGAPIVTPVLRPGIPMVAPPEKPQTTVYVGKIAPTADNEFLLSLLRLCGPVKSWKRAQDPSDGTPKGFGFCEFESAEGILRAMRVLSRLNIYGQELVLNINQATREYLERYVEKKTEREKPKENEAQVSEKENESALDVVIKEPPKPIVEETNKDAEESGDKENHEKTQNFGIVTEGDRDADKDALEKITSMIEERLKTKPLPPPPPVQAPVDGTAKSNSDVHSDILSKSKDDDSDVDIVKSDLAEEKNDDEPMSENQPVTEHERPEISSADKGRRHDRSSRENGRERDLKRVKELNVERYERERERDRARRERDRETKIREAERQYRDRVKLLETREREKEYQRHREKEREKEKERERRREISKDENESDDDDTRKRRRRSSVYEEKRRRRQREKEEDLDDRLKEGEDLADRLKEEEYLAERLKVEKDLADRLKEEEEIADAKEAAIEEQPSEDDPMHLCSQVINEIGKPINQEAGFKVEGRENPLDQSCESVSASDNTGYGFYRSNSSDELAVGSAAASDMKQNSNVPAKKLGFGIIGSGKRTTVLSVFHEEDDEDADDKKMRPLVPIDYSTEELQAVPSPSGPPPNLVAATEFAKRISGVNPREDKREMERERRSSHRERDRYDDEHTRGRNGNKEKMHDKSFDRERDREDKPKPENKKLLDAKQLIDMIPKTKEELFAYEINWAVYDKHDLHGRMRPWISKKVTEFLGEEEPTLVDYIVSSTKDHVHASKMLDLLQSILDDEAEMFVLKMWRMLIFEIKKVEVGLSGKPRG